MVASSLALPTSFRTASFKSALGKCFQVLKGVILSEIDSRNGPIKLEYFVTPCSKYIYLYHLTSLLMHAIGPKVWIKWGHNPHFLFPRVATRSKPRMSGWYK